MPGLPPERGGGPPGKRRPGRDLLDEPTKGSLRKSGGDAAPGRFGSLDEAPRGTLKDSGGGRSRRPAKPQFEESVEEKFFDRFKYLVVAGLGLGVIGLVVLIVFTGESGDSGGDGADRPRLESLKDPEVFREAYLEANGGEGFLRGIRSIRAKGTIEADGESLPFFLIKRAPDKSLFRVQTEAGEVSVGTDGDDVWRSISRNGRIEQVYFLEGPERWRTLRTSRFFGGLLHHFMFGTDTLGEIELFAEEGSAEIRVYLRSEDGREVRHDVDAETLDLLRTVQVEGEEESGQLYSDYRDLGGLRQPFRVETVVDGRTVSVAALDSAEINPGVLSLSFERPVTDAPGRMRGGWNMEEDVRLRRAGQSFQP